MIKLTQEEYGVLWLAGWYRQRLLDLEEGVLRPDVALRTIPRLLMAGLLEECRGHWDDAGATWVTVYLIAEAGVQACRAYERRGRHGND